MYQPSRCFARDASCAEGGSNVGPDGAGTSCAAVTRGRATRTASSFRMVSSLGSGAASALRAEARLATGRLVTNRAGPQRRPRGGGVADGRPPPSVLAAIDLQRSRASLVVARRGGSPLVGYAVTEVVRVRFTVEPNYAGWRLDRYLQEKIRRLSRERVQRLIETRVETATGVGSSPRRESSPASRSRSSRTSSPSPRRRSTSASCTTTARSSSWTSRPASPCTRPRATSRTPSPRSRARASPTGR